MFAALVLRAHDIELVVNVPSVDNVVSSLQPPAVSLGKAAFRFSAAPSVLPLSPKVRLPANFRSLNTAFNVLRCLTTPPRFTPELLIGA